MSRNDKLTHCSPSAAAPVAWIEAAIIGGLGLLGLWMLFGAEKAGAK
jgi:hypothetical protein